MAIVRRGNGDGWRRCDGSLDAGARGRRLPGRAVSSAA
jgi:hypothetical protein